MIVETADNRKFYVVPGPQLIPQCWMGFEVKRVKGAWTPKKNAKPVLVRKEGSRVVDPQ